MRVAFVGMGRMGVAMAAHVLDAGHELHVWNRTPGRAAALVEAGAVEAASPEEAVRGADAVVLMLFGPPSVREVLPAVVAGAPEGALLINATTVAPADAREFAATAAACATSTPRSRARPARPARGRSGSSAARPSSTGPTRCPCCSCGAARRRSAGSATSARAAR